MTEQPSAANRHDTAKFTDRELEDELNNRPRRHRSEAYLTALRLERARRALRKLPDDPDDSDGIEVDDGFGI